MEIETKQELINIINKLKTQNHNLTLNNIKLKKLNKEILGGLDYIIKNIENNQYEFKIELLNDVNYLYNDIEFKLVNN